MVMESHQIIKELKISLSKINVYDYEDYECYEENRLRIEDSITRERKRYESNLRDGLDMKSDFSSSKLVEYKEAECDWLILDTVYCDNQSPGVTGDVVADEIEDDIDIGVNRTTKEIGISDSCDTQL